MQPKTTKEEELEATFNELVKIWRKETGFHSNDYFIVNHPAYQQIIEMGEAVLPLIFREMETNGGHWFWALRAITGANPEPPPKKLPAGWVGLDIKAIYKAWLQWGREQGYEW